MKFRKASCKRVLEAAKRAYANKTKESQKLDSHVFWKIANNVFKKGKSSIPLCLVAICCFLLLIKQNCLLKT